MIQFQREYIVPEVNKTFKEPSVGCTLDGVRTVQILVEHVIIFLMQCISINETLQMNNISIVSEASMLRENRAHRTRKIYPILFQ